MIQPVAVGLIVGHGYTKIQGAGRHSVLSISGRPGAHP
jgi:hypothetical protein